MKEEFLRMMLAKAESKPCDTGEWINPRAIAKISDATSEFFQNACSICGLTAEEYARFGNELGDMPKAQDACSRRAWLEFYLRLFGLLTNCTKNGLKVMDEKWPKA